MGRHDDDDHHHHHGDHHDHEFQRKSRKHETREERLLRKAKEYVEREERKEDGARRPRNGDGDGVGQESLSRSATNTHRARSRDKEEDRRDRKRKRDHREDRKRSPRHHADTKPRKKEAKKGSRKERSSTVKKLTIDKSKLYPLGPIPRAPPSALLDTDSDYFAHHQHLWVYLYRDEGIIFGDLTSEEARASFQRFCEKYNAGNLEQAYYKEGALPQQAVDECKMTRHKWAFQTSEVERKSLQLVEEGVRKQTEYDADMKSDPVSLPLPRLPPQHSEEAGNSNMETSKERPEERRANRRLRDHVRTAEEELVGGRKDGRERLLEKKQERAAAIHASARDRDAHMGGAELDDSTLYGGDGSGFHQALAREKQRKAQRSDRAADRIQELQQKEDDRKKAMLASLGLANIQPGQKITIQPR
jgi:hypothetical protein